MEARARAPAGSIPENLDEECAETARFLAAALKHLLRAADGCIMQRLISVDSFSRFIHARLARRLSSNWSVW